MRSIYAEVCNQVFNAQDQSNTLYVADILGLGRGQLLTWDLITDTQTPLSYLSDFRLTGIDCVCQPEPETKDLDNSKFPPTIYIQEELNKEAGRDRLLLSIPIQEELSDEVKCDRSSDIYIQEDLNKETGSDRIRPIYIQEDLNKEVGRNSRSAATAGAVRTQNISIQEE